MTCRSGCSFDTSATSDAASWAWGLGGAVLPCPSPGPELGRHVGRAQREPDPAQPSTVVGLGVEEPTDDGSGAPRTAVGPKHRSSRHRCLATPDGDQLCRPSRLLSQIHGIDSHRCGAAAGRGPLARTPRVVSRGSHRSIELSSPVIKARITRKKQAEEAHAEEPARTVR